MYKQNAASSLSLLYMDLMGALNINDYISKIKTTFDPITGDFSSSASIHSTEPREWGSVVGLDQLDHSVPLIANQTNYFHELIEILKNAGYTDRVDLCGAPYDFRLESYVSVKKAGRLFSKMKSLIESMFSNNGDSAVVLVSHSEGSTIIRHFLANYVDQAWKDKHIKVWISAAGAFAGAPSAFHQLVSARTWMIPMVSGSDTHRVLEFFAGVYWMLPSRLVFPATTPLATVSAHGITYTVDNILEAFQTTFNGEMLDAATFTLDAITAEFAAPNVELRAYYGTGLDTVGSAEYKSADAEWWMHTAGSAEVVDSFVDGDGTVPVVSAKAPEQWTDTNTKPISLIPMPGVEHVAMIKNERFIQDVLDIALGEKEDPDSALLPTSSVHAVFYLSSFLLFLLFSFFSFSF